jgi:CRISPR-associated RAMP protein (TIGR02581 family)
MFRRSYNRAVVRLRIETRAPLLIRAGDSGLDPTGTDLSCVRTRHARFGRTVYVPGSSLKGVLRSTAEAAVRGRRFGDAEGACDVFGPAACGGRRGNNREREATSDVHRRHCLACRLFGSTAMKGRCSVRDLFPWPGDVVTLTPDQQANLEAANRTELRNSVAIDRITGSVKHGPFDSEMVPAGVLFYGDVALENYQAWQLGLLATALGELNDGFAQLGSTKSRGFGVVRVDVTEVLHEQPLTAGDRPLGVGALAGADESRAYGLLAESDLPAAAGLPRGLGRRFRLEGADAQAWLEAGRTALEGLA